MRTSRRALTATSTAFYNTTTAVVLERALAIDEAVYGPDHPDLAIRLNNLGTVLRALGDLAGARATFERALALVEAALSPNHPTVAPVINNLGLVLRDLGDLDGARAGLHRALSIIEPIYGTDDFRVAAVRRDLKALYS